jgi:nitrogenase iron protein NifH
MEKNRMKIRIVIYGKGGIGKSTIATHLSVSYASEGLKVLHIGCDPKMDSSMKLTGNMLIPNICDFIRDGTYNERNLKDLIVRGKFGIDCMETGGPEPGKGCSGRGVASLVDFLVREKIDKYPYDVIIFDVLGDLVCGGFVAPLRAGLGNRIYIVASDEPMSLYAANNISSVALDYINDDIFLNGIIYNIKNPIYDEDILIKFAGRINIPVIDILPYDPLIRRAEQNNATVLEYAPDSETAKRFKKLSKRIIDLNEDKSVVPSPLSRKEFIDFISRHYEPI